MQGSRKEEGGLIATTLPPNGLTTKHLPFHPPTYLTYLSDLTA